MIESYLNSFLKSYFQDDAYTMTLLAQSGSSRRNYLIEATKTQYILTYNEKVDENECFFYLTEAFYKLEIKVPKIFKISEDRKIYLQEFLGQNTLSEIISKEGHSYRVKELVRACIQELVKLQQKSFGKIDFSRAYEYEVYDDLPITHDLYYFKNFFVDVLELDYHKGKLLKEFKKIVNSIQQLPVQCVMLRDFQSRNIMVSEQDVVSFIDYQAAMQGPATYDLVSFLFQAKANFPQDWQEEFLEYYLELNQEQFTRENFIQSVQYCKLIRFLQVLGAYGFRGLIQKKQHFIESIPRGIKNISEIADTWKEMHQYPELLKVINQLSQIQQEGKIESLYLP
ncbi:aminoglycoside phosphotransferase family protein [Elizabethkingia sp. JS20170427COW]|uniref:aminoglycoside phosphotransferase family protein n=1 Tax=Elizabethkingia sp. JS20170427COW TaxID=2583851 RepID=UPI00111082B7|nr:aminoglycoside phosphotransferase family protein [Elizabethkingia sp. JS20170427COW]QCX52978.1 aminoglycoside phosphotransferase family protein [Elizabethkingia sp. JS20170427COW]